MNIFYTMKIYYNFHITRISIFIDIKGILSIAGPVYVISRKRDHSYTKTNSSLSIKPSNVGNVDAGFQGSRYTVYTDLHNRSWLFCLRGYSIKVSSYLHSDQTDNLAPHSNKCTWQGAHGTSTTEQRNVLATQREIEWNKHAPTCRTLVHMMYFIFTIYYYDIFKKFITINGNETSISVMITFSL